MRIFGAIHGLGRRQQEKVTAAALERCETPQQLIVAISYTLSRFLQPHPASGYASPAMVTAMVAAHRPGCGAAPRSCYASPQTWTGLREAGRVRSRGVVSRRCSLCLRNMGE